MERGEIVGGRYWVKHCLHRAGGYAVHAAVDLRDSTAVRLRTYTDVTSRGLDHFERTATRLAAVETSLVERVRAFGATPEGNLYAASLLPGGAPLDHLLAQAISSQRRALIARRAIEALAGLHALELTHGAISTKNLYVTDDDDATVALADLTLVPPSQIAMDASVPSVSVDVAEGIAPEVLRGQSAPAGASDVFAMGVALFELLTGTAPFRADTLLATYLRVLYEDPTPTRLDPSLAGPLAAVRRMLDKSPKTRPTPRELLASLGQARTSTEDPGDDAPTLFTSTPSVGIILFEMSLASSLVAEESVEELERKAGVSIVRLEGSTLVAEVPPAGKIHPVLAAARVASRLRVEIPDAVFAISVGGRGSIEAAAALLPRAPRGTITLTQEHVQFVERDFDMQPFGGTLTLWDRGQPTQVTAVHAAVHSLPTQEFTVDPALLDGPTSSTIEPLATIEMPRVSERLSDPTLPRMTISNEQTATDAPAPELPRRAGRHDS
jgi:hypothetical protein